MNDGPGISVLDGGHRSCVVLLMELRRHVSAIAPGDVVHLIAHDPAAPLDLAAWCHLTGHTYLGPVPGDQPTYAVRVEADALATAPRSPWRRGQTPP
ncbi:sulfurtransferase TusA family protein [Streptosporangium sp. CA-115845]|uniref:sulfurtransferase TusA family protein n=1 Tax=Streptosporangium sp. CA-115845 TaxID=3240071 RepID=UPI003D8E0176